MSDQVNDSPMPEGRSQLPAIDIVEFTRRVCQNWLIVLLAAIIGSLALYATVSFWPNTYEASSKLIYDPAESKIISENSTLSPLARRYYNALAEAEIIQADSVLERVISKMKLDQNDEFLRGTTQALFIANAKRAIFGLFPALRSYDISEPAPALSDQQRRRLAMARMRQGLEINMSRLTTIVTVTFKSTQAKLAADICNAIMDAYNEVNRERKLSVAGRASDGLQVRLDKLLPKVVQLDKRIVELQSAYGLQGKTTTDTADTLGKEGRLLQKEINTLKELEISRSEELRQVRANSGSATRNGIQSSEQLGSDIRAQLVTARKREADQLARFGPRHPWVLRARNEVRLLRRQIRDEVKQKIKALIADLDSIKMRKERLEQRLQATRSELAKTRSSAVALEKLKREASATRNLYVSLLSRQKEAEEIKELRTTDFQIIARAIQPGAASRTKPLLVGVALLAGCLGLGLTGAAASAYFSTNLRSAKEFHIAAGVPTVAVIPKVKSEDITKEAMTGSTAFRSSIDQLRTWLEPHEASSRGQIVLISSACGSAGKSVTAHAVAHRAAQAKTKTLLVDLDLASKVRTPRLVDENGPAQSEPKFQKCEDTQMMEAYYSHSSMPLHKTVLGDGSSESLLDTMSTGSISKYLTGLRSKYELIVVDGPSVSAAPDAALLSEMADATYVVATWNRTRKSTLRKVVDRLERRPGQVKGVIVNQASGNYVERFNSV